MPGYRFGFEFPRRPSPPSLPIDALTLPSYLVLYTLTPSFFRSPDSPHTNGRSLLPLPDTRRRVPRPRASLRLITSCSSISSTSMLLHLSACTMVLHLRLDPSVSFMSPAIPLSLVSTNCILVPHICVSRPCIHHPP
ncbi:hypothetical protein H4582DRAFT_2130835 [Lactarius indigo]|nr:hypothetical protein H4582DRAFT_2130835 [Lactarius indigo]